MRAYFDWNATTPPSADVLDAMREAGRTAWANPSSIHGDGRRARAVVEDARAAVADLVGANARDVVFTSGGTEANNVALRSVFGETRASAPPWLLTSRLEHPSVTKVAEALEAEARARVRWLHVTRDGTLDLEDLRSALEATRDSVGLVTAQAVNHETGIVQPLEAIAALVRAYGARLHVDAIQAWGKIDLGVRRASMEGGAACALDAKLPPWDSVSIAAHKLRGPKGIGALVTRPATRLLPVLLGGAQEKGIRPGTTDPALAAGFGVASRRAIDGPSRYEALRHLRDTFDAELLTLAARASSRAPRVVGEPTLRAPHVSTLVWPGWVGAELVAALDLEGVSVSSGAACSAGTVDPSPVLAAMLGEDDATRGVRVSLGDLTTLDDVRFGIEAFRRVLSR